MTFIYERAFLDKGLMSGASRDKQEVSIGSDYFCSML